MKKIKQLQIAFQLPIYHRQIPQWRGAIIEWAGLEKDRFHNHKTGQERYYRYPLIQYFVWNRQAAILALNEGAHQLEDLLAQKEWRIRWRDQTHLLQTDQVQLDWPSVGLTEQMHTYQLQHWLPFNQQNYQWWSNEARDLKARATKLEKILLAHLLTFATGIRWQIPGQLIVRLQHIQRTKRLRFHQTPMVAFDICFECNLRLPEGIRLGRVVSHGFGELKWRSSPPKDKLQQDRNIKPIRAF
ncbi:MAG: CRISPR-associated endonuclease Cas6 [Bacteroidota bacterium]